ncbi:MAG TPA: hypothetical protein VE981_00695 [Planctomycetota bacterium]|nr:hypothetical protein [Planctomycetota bacterium]
MLAILAISGCGHRWALGLVPLAGVYATCTIGFSGGPNHGEHPFIVNAIHLTAFCLKSSHGPRPPYGTCFGLLLAATVQSLLVQGLRGGWTDRPVRLNRLAMAALYVGMTGIVIFGDR